ncbi:PREDICTED: uncharacterized protein LOC105368854 [Ceratosolen solmsi marchali]|uniref:Uncharacterized protein LOC105368854 n=1 Tax=Ceratosolen solmsi marchali TaxID=326594 RepID=A0AAJ6YXR2_9HYME|nr:PREDICTED: uncharacterized protein LOC105368854 [Ceratosolen solmsi marchali]
MEVCINMRVFKALILVNALLVMGLEANPLLQHSRERESKPGYNDNPEADSKKELSSDHYDQRQNGTENYRVKVDGLVFILAPADSLLLAGAALEPNFTSLFSESGKPKPKLEKDYAPKAKDDKVEALKSTQQDHAHMAHKYDET